MGNKGVHRRIRESVIESVKKSGCWEQEETFSCAVGKMAGFCIFKNKEFKEWVKKKRH